MTAQDAILAAFDALGGEASPAELGAVTGLSPRTRSDALGKLRERGLVGGPRDRPRLTALAKARARAALGAAGDDFDAAVEAIFGPSPAFSAFVRLGADLIVARQLHPGRRFYPSLLAYGERSGTGKTAVAEVLASAIGLELSDAIVQMGHKAPGEIVGRRVPGIGNSYRFEPAEHLGYPFVCFDELGESDAAVRRQVQALCHGDPRPHIEDEVVDLRATVMATWNPRKGAIVLSEPYLRRAVVLCADAPGVAFADLSPRLRAAEISRTGADTIRPGELSAVVERLSDEVVSVLAGCAAVLTEEGRARYDSRTLELATLGRAARQRRPASELAPVAYFVAADWLIVTETVPGLVDDGWAIALDAATAYWGDVAGMSELAHIARQRTDLREATRGQVARQRTAREQIDLELVGERAALREMLDGAAKAIVSVPPAHKPSAAGLRAELRSLRDAAGDARSASRLAVVRDLAIPVLGAASALRDAIDSERRAQQQSEADQAAERKASAAALRSQKTADAKRETALSAQRRHLLTQLRSARTPVKAKRQRTKTKPGEDVCGWLVAHRVVRRELEDYVEEIPPFPGRATFARVRRAPAPGPTVRRGTREVFRDADGQRYDAGELKAWGTPAVHRVIDAWLAMVKEIERQLLAGESPSPAAGARPALGPGSRASVLDMLPGPELGGGLS